MKTPDKLIEKNVALLVGTEALDLYLKEISWNLRTMIGQADVLETAIIKMKKQLYQHGAPERLVAHLNSAQSFVQEEASRHFCGAASAAQ